MPANPLVQIVRGLHEVSNQVTAFQLQAAFEMHVGAPVRLPFRAEVQAIRIEDDQAVIKYRRYDATVLTHETRVRGAVMVAEIWLRGDTGWGRMTSHEAPDDTVTPHAVHESGRAHRDENEQRTRRAFEADCYRPGGGRAPLDNADRTAEGYTTKAMERHWA